MAQVVPGAGAAIGGVAADRARLAELRGVPEATRADSMGDRLGPRLLRPYARVQYNSALPEGGGDGPLWSGRGLNGALTAGAAYRARVGALTLDATLAPTVGMSQNADFQVFPNEEPGRSPFSSPWHPRVHPIDLPLRFGERPIRFASMGQSEVRLTGQSLAGGVSTVNEWWGPSLRNTLVLGDNAEGIPRVFLRRARPWRTRLGALDGRVIAGVLTESPYFDTDDSNDLRSASGFLVTLRPSADTGLTLGVSRLVVAPVSSASAALGHALDAVTRWEPVAFRGDSGALAAESRTDQVTSLFARWVIPGAGLESYVEWARYELPRSLRELLVYPQHAQGYTVGLQWADPGPRNAFLRVQVELTDLEQAVIIPGRTTVDFYTGIAAPQGFTQRGQLLGAPVGPGGSSQFVALDRVASRWQVGGFVARRRTENDAFYRQPGIAVSRHDVTVGGGLRGALRTDGWDVSVSLAMMDRLNYLFQNLSLVPGTNDAVDVRNVALTLRVAPR